MAPIGHVYIIYIVLISNLFIRLLLLFCCEYCICYYVTAIKGLECLTFLEFDIVLISGSSCNTWHMYSTVCTCLNWVIWHLIWLYFNAVKCAKYWNFCWSTAVPVCAIYHLTYHVISVCTRIIIVFCHIPITLYRFVSIVINFVYIALWYCVLLVVNV